MPMHAGRRWPALAAVALWFAACSEGGAPSGASTAGSAGVGGGAGAPTGGGTAAGGEASGGGATEVGGDGNAGASGNDEGGASGAGDESDPYRSLRRMAYPATPYPSENPDSDAKALLGKVLFWDEQLSGDDTVACGTCHRPSAGGSDPRSTMLAARRAGPDGVVGTDDDIHGSLGLVRCNADGEQTGTTVQVTTRKAPSYLDAMFSPRLFWDGRAECRGDACPSFAAFEDPDAPGTFPIRFGGALEIQAVGPPLSDVEMACENASWANIHAKLALATPLALARQAPQPLVDFIAENGGSYPALFSAAFGDEQTSGPRDEINTRRIAFAIATHERRLRSDQTPWDRFNAGEDDALTPAQIRGLDLFLNKAKCEGCHRMPITTDGDFHFIGFHRPSWDLGRNAIDPDFGVPGAMRTPTLRNVGLRESTGLLRNGAGTGSSLAKIIDLYDLGGLLEDPEVVAAPIDAAMEVLSLTPGEKADLLDFLQHGLEDPRVAKQTAPFDRPWLSTE